MDVVRRHLWLSQGILLLSMLICSLLLPSVVRTNGGVSNFGNHLRTVVPYSLGFLAYAGFLFLAARKLLKGKKRARRFGISLLPMVFLVFLVYLSTFPRHDSLTYSEIHDYLGIVLYDYELVFAAIVISRQFNLRSVSFLLLQIAGSVLGLLSILKVIHILYIGQVIGAAGFALVLVFIFPQLVTKEAK